MMNDYRRPLFERRHYVAIAAVIAILPDDVREQVAAHFADRLKGTNAGYDGQRFREAAQGTPRGRDK